MLENKSKWNDAISIGVTALAFIGDSLYENKVRLNVISDGGSLHADTLHKRAVKYVNAQSQSIVAKCWLGDGEDGRYLTDDEKTLLRKARNKKSVSKSRSAGPREYKLATAFEALIGALWLSGNEKRANEVMAKAIEMTDRRLSSEQSR